MFCPACGATATKTLKYCRACGHPLSEHARLIESLPNLEQEKKQKRKMSRLLDEGVMLLLTSQTISLLFWLLTALSASEVKSKDKAILSLGALTTLFTVTISILYLYRSDYFGRLKKRLFGTSSLLDDLKSGAAKNETSVTRELPDALSSNELPPATNVMDFTEHTTRELQLRPRISGEIK